MRVFLTLLLVSSVCAFQCPKQCVCGTADELEHYCTINDANVTIKGRTGEYVNIRCTGTNFTCTDLPSINFGRKAPLPSLSVSGCSPSILQCLPKTLETSSIHYVTVNVTGELMEQDVAALGDVHDLVIQDCKTTIPASALKRQNNLKSLRISLSKLTLYSNKLLELPSIKFLELSMDEITDIPEDTFNGLNDLRIFNFWGNNIEEIRRNAFRGLDSLESLTLNTNNISRIEPGTFARTPKLKALILNYNRLEELPTGLFENLTQIENITLHGNKIELKLQPFSLANLPTLKNLRLDSNKITSLPEDLLTNNSGLKTLLLNRNFIKNVTSNFFSSLENLEELDLSWNKIEYLNGDTFSWLKKLKRINLSRNYLEVLPDLLFTGLKNLNYVTIDDNFLTTIQPLAFQGATELTTISLKGNKLTFKSPDSDFEGTYLDFLPPSPLYWAHKLKRLILSGNNIDTMFDDWKNVMVALEELDLSYNSFTTLLSYDVQFLSNKVTVDLRYNNISNLHLNYATQERLSNSTISERGVILLDDNPLHCDCVLYTLALRLRGARSLTAEPKFDVGNARCQSPTPLKGRLFKNLSLLDLNCILDDEDCPMNCSNCVLRPGFDDILLNCKEIPKFLPDPVKLGVSNISLKLSKPPKTIDNLSIQTLNLSGIDLKYVPFKPSPNISTIDLSNNNLSMIPIEFLESNTSLFLGGNAVDCDCWFSNEISLIKESGNIKDLDKVFCEDGRSIETLDVVSLCNTFRAIIVGSGVFMILVFTIAFTIILMFKYRHEIYIYVTSKGLLPCLFKDDLTDINKTYDIFISYAHKDLKFVKEILPKLENDFEQKTCIHYRDWDVGDLIPDQIQRSVEKSRKTLILLSSNFLESAYANMEFRTAHNLALKEGRNIVILILLEDVTKNEKLTDELKAYISTNTYLSWDDPKFYDKLHRALPRKNPKKFVWPEIIKQAGEKTVKCGLDVQLNSEGKLVNVAVKDV